MAEIPADFMVWTKAPEVMYREDHRRHGAERRRKLPRLKIRNAPTSEVRNLLTYSPKLRRRPCVRYRIKDRQKSPMVWEAKCVPAWIKNENGLPVGPYRLLITLNVLQRNEVKFFLRDAPEGIPVKTLLLVAFSRWRSERMFEDTKDKLGVDYVEVRKYRPIQRHLVLTGLSHLCIAEFRQEHWEKPGTGRLPTANCDDNPRTLVAPRGSMLEETSRVDRCAISLNPRAKICRSESRPQANCTTIAGNRCIPQCSTHIQEASKAALSY